MLCSSIKLTDRKEIKQKSAPKRNKSSMLEQKLFMTSEYCHSYTFRWDKPKKFYNGDSVQHLSVNDIMLPENTKTFNTGASTEKWSKKRPRLQSTKQEPQKSVSKNLEDTFDVTPLLNQLSDEDDDDTPETEVNELKESTCSSESELDPDIQNLLTIAQIRGNEEIHSNDSGSANPKRRRKKHRSKRKDKQASDENSNEKPKKKKKKPKTIKFSLSKPPSPQTVQVIRVDVTSNYSFEEVDAVESNRTDTNISDCSKGCGKRIRSTNNLKNALNNIQAKCNDNESQEIKIECNRLVLGNRK